MCSQASSGAKRHKTARTLKEARRPFAAGEGYDKIWAETVPAVCSGFPGEVTGCSAEMGHNGSGPA